MPKTALNLRKAPLQARAQATCESILEAATQLLSRHGLAGFNTNAVAARAGVSIGSLYQYFPNKDALMVALIHRQQQRQQRSVSEAVANLPDGNLESTVRVIVRAAMQHHRDDSLLASAIDHEEARLPIADILDDYMSKGGAVLGQVMARYPDELRGLDAERAGRTLPALIRAVVDGWSNLPTPQLDVAEDEAVRAVLGYLRASSQATTSRRKE